MNFELDKSLKISTLLLYGFTLSSLLYVDTSPLQAQVNSVVFQDDTYNGQEVIQKSIASLVNDSDKSSAKTSNLDASNQNLVEKEKELIEKLEDSTTSSKTKPKRLIKKTSKGIKTLPKRVPKLAKKVKKQQPREIVPYKKVVSAPPPKISSSKSKSIKEALNSRFFTKGNNSTAKKNSIPVTNRKINIANTSNKQLIQLVANLEKQKGLMISKIKGLSLENKKLKSKLKSVIFKDQNNFSEIDDLRVKLMVAEAQIERLTSHLQKKLGRSAISFLAKKNGYSPTKFKSNNSNSSSSFSGEEYNGKIQEFETKQRPSSSFISSSNSNDVANSFATVSTERVNLRTGPGIEHSIITTLPQDTPLKVETKSGNWYKATSPSGISAWIHKSAITFTRINQPSSESEDFARDTVVETSRSSSGFNPSNTNDSVAANHIMNLKIGGQSNRPNSKPAINTFRNNNPLNNETQVKVLPPVIASSVRKDIR